MIQNKANFVNLIWNEELPLQIVDHGFSSHKQAYFKALNIAIHFHALILPRVKLSSFWKRFHFVS